MIHRRDEGEGEKRTSRRQYFIDMADEASSWPANIINLGSIYPRLWWRAADPKKTERLAACPRGERAKRERGPRPSSYFLIFRQ